MSCKCGVKKLGVTNANGCEAFSAVFNLTGVGIEGVEKADCETEEWGIHGTQRPRRGDCWEGFFGERRRGWGEEASVTVKIAYHD